jgi:hypothetical protein
MPIFVNASIRKKIRNFIDLKNYLGGKEYYPDNRLVILNNGLRKLRFRNKKDTPRM